MAEYVHETFYSPIARDRSRPARVQLCRLTARQHRTVVAGLIGGFRGPEPPLDDQRGLGGEYFHGRHEFVIRSQHSVRLYVNAAKGDRPLIDG